MLIVCFVLFLFYFVPLHIFHMSSTFNMRKLFKQRQQPMKRKQVALKPLIAIYWHLFYTASKRIPHW